MSTDLTHIGPHHDIVISTRVRIARNVEGYPYPHKLNADRSLALMHDIQTAVKAFPEHEGERYIFTSLDKLDGLERQALVEEHVISPALLANADKSGFFYNKGQGVSIMVNEEDHIRIQSMLQGFRPEAAWKEADQVDNLLGKNLPYAFDDTFGYLTACPTNLGTGTRVSIMLHLPALTLMGHTDGFIQAASQLGFAVRGLFGEGSEYMGNLYQVSNQITLGLAEHEIISRLEDVVIQVIQKERLARRNLFESKKIDLEDRIFRSLGILSFARKLTRKEAMQYLSDLKLGTSMGMISTCTLIELQTLMELIQPAKLQQHYGKQMEETERDRQRAELIRSTLNGGGPEDVNE